MPARARDQIAKVLLSERIELPAVLNELRGQDAALRGSQDAQPFRLISPSRTVIISDRPTLEWEKAAGASSYRVYVNDQSGNEVAKSQDLSSELNNWTLPKVLKRGEIYNWTVVAIIDEKEIVSPGPSMPEIKFQVLSAYDLPRLIELKRVQSHLALGLFYVQVGLISEAEREFQILVRKNPDSSSARRLLIQIQALRSYR